QPSEGRRLYFNPADVETRAGADGSQIHEVTTESGQKLQVTHEGLGTMSKSKNNGVDPQSLVDRYGADTARLLLMFAAPPEQTLEWSDEGVQGSYRFIRRLWNAVYEHVSAGMPSKLDVTALTPAQKDIRRQVHQTLVKVTHDIGRRRVFNTAIAAVMELL